MEIKNIKENKELKDKIIEIIDQDIRKMVSKVNMSI